MQVWLIPIADERVGVQVKLWNPLRTRAIPERLSAVVIHYEEALYQVYAPLPLPSRRQDEARRGRRVVSHSGVGRSNPAAQHGHERWRYVQGGGQCIPTIRFLDWHSVSTLFRFLFNRSVLPEIIRC